MTLQFGLIGERTGVQSSDYKSAGSNQSENLIYLQTNDANYHLVFTVPTGQTWYLSGILYGGGGNIEAVFIATGEAASEVDVNALLVPANDSLIVTMPTPIKFSSGTKISVKSGGSGVHHNLVGWIE